MESTYSWERGRLDHDHGNWSILLLCMLNEILRDGYAHRVSNNDLWNTHTESVNLYKNLYNTTE